MSSLEIILVKNNVPSIVSMLFVVVISLCAGCSTKNVGDMAEPGLLSLVSQIAPASAKAGSSVVLTGRGFGNDPAAVSVVFGDREARVSSVSDTSMDVQVPLDAGSPLTVAIAGQDAIISASFTYITETLIVSSFTPQEGTPGTQVTISGEGFGTNTEWLDVSFGEKAAEVLSSAQDGLRTVVPIGSESGAITIRRGNQEVQSAEFFIVTEPIPPALPPTFISFTPPGVFPMEEVQLSGEHFGSDLETLQVFVGGKEARVVALADNELVIRPVPGTQNGIISIETAGGETQSTSELTIKPYPEYFGAIKDVSAHTLAPGGLFFFDLEVPLNGAGIARSTLGGEEVKKVARFEGEQYLRWYQIGLSLDGEYYLGIPNNLKDEDKPAGVEEDVWVTAYYEPVITVTTEGMNPPQTTGLSPPEIYGNYVGVDSAFVAMQEADYNSPIAVFADNELIMFYSGDETWAHPDEYIAQGGLSIRFNNPPELFELGDHSIMVVTTQGYSVANPGYNVLSLDEVEIYVDTVSPQTAQAGDIITLSGKNLHWRAAGSLGMSPHEVRVGGVRMPVVPTRWFPPNSALDETQFLLIGDAVSGEIEIDFQEDEHKQVVRTTNTGLTLNVDREYIDGFERYMKPEVTSEEGTISGWAFSNGSRLTEDGKLYVAYMETVDYGERYQKLGYFSPAGFTDLGRIDQAPNIFLDFTGGSGPTIHTHFVTILPSGDPCVRYLTLDKRDDPYAVEYYDLRLAVYHESGTEIFPFLMTNSETGEGTDGPKNLFIAYDELGNYWGRNGDDLIKWDGIGWSIVGPSMPETMHHDPVSGDVQVKMEGPMYAEPNGQLKMYDRVINSSYDYLAFYFIERHPDGAWEFNQILGKEEYPTSWTFDREGRARIFTNDTEKFYIRREENGFIKEDWADIPYPTGAVWPESREYDGKKATDLNLEVEYDHLNRPIGWFSCKLSTTWEDAIEDNSGTYVCNFLMYGNGSGEIEFEQVGAYVIDTAPWGSDNRLLGQVIDWNLGSGIELSPSGSKLVVLGARSEYELVDTVVYMHWKGRYVYSRSL